MEKYDIEMDKYNRWVAPTIHFLHILMNAASC
jgi:hypothetical protein